MEERYGKLTIIERADAPEHLKDKKSIYYLCKCDCGNDKVIKKSSLTSGTTTSCGCHRRESQSERAKKQVKHGLSGTRFMSIWFNMKGRCQNPKDNQYHNYGAKGVKICDKWQTFQNFIDDMYQSYVQFENKHGKDTASIDRIDSNGNYEPNNCKWATQLEQSKNRNNNIKLVIDGVEYNTLTEIAERYSIGYDTLLRRYHEGKRDKELVKPLRPKSDKQKTAQSNRKGIEVEVNGKHYKSIRDLQKDYPYISEISLQKRFHKGLRGDDLIRRPRTKQNIV